MSGFEVERSGLITIPPPLSAHLMPDLRASSSRALIPMAKHMQVQSIFSPSSKVTPTTLFSSSVLILPTRLLSRTSRPSCWTCSTTMPPASPSSCLLSTHLLRSINLTLPNSSRSIIAFAASKPSRPPPTTTPVVPCFVEEKSMSFCRSSIVR